MKELKRMVKDGERDPDYFLYIEPKEKDGHGKPEPKHDDFSI
jgi:hypothetical protein